MQTYDDLIFDVGAHIGNDTDFYLRKGYRVVAVEAAPGLVRQCKTRFANEIASGQLILEEVAISDAAEKGEISFFINPEYSEWGTTDKEWVKRNTRFGSDQVEKLRVPAIEAAELFRRHGVPHYMKVDIEGADRSCLHAVVALDTPPRFFSIESDKLEYDAVCEDLRLLQRAGYRRFAVVQQAGYGFSTINTRTRHGEDLSYQFQPSVSGPFGDDLPSEKWVTLEEAEREYRRVFREYRWFGDNQPRLIRQIGIVLGKLRNAALPGWYDTHARLD